MLANTSMLRILFVSVLVLTITMSFSWGVEYCPGGICDTGLTWPCEINCDSYTETVTPYATTPVYATTHTDEQIFESITDNCDHGQAIDPWTVTSQWLDTESITHTANGSLTSTIGLSLGNDAVSKLSLAYAITAGNGWEKQDTHTNTNYGDERSTVVLPYTKVSFVETGNYIDGTFSKWGELVWSAPVRPACLGGWNTGSGSCSQTTSQANGANRVYTSTTGAFHDLDCQSGE